MESKHEAVDIRVPIELDNPAIRRIESQCIRCGACRDVCAKEISIGGHFALDKTNDHAICIHCGQCANVCPTGAIVEKQEWMDVEEAIHNPEKTVIVLTSPSVRVALAEEFNGTPGTYSEDSMVGALRALGVDYVLDTTFAADLTIMEEASELISRIQNNRPLPQFTSCCPAWVKFVETYYPKYLPNVSTSKSPISMFGPVVKTWFAKEHGLAPENIVTVALTPCTAKKFEIRREEMQDAGKELEKELGADVNYVVTTRELGNWMRARNLDMDNVPASTYDTLMERGSGAGVIFGGSGGVMEAALRTAYYFLTNTLPPENFLNFTALRGLQGIKTASVEIAGIDVHVAVVQGTDNARRFIKEMEQGDTSYTFVEVMTCRGGCIGGGGQPKHIGANLDEIREQRAAGLYNKDAQMTLRYSHENPDIIRIYDDYLKQPLSPLAKRLLHTSYIDRSSDLQEDPVLYEEQYQHVETTVVKQAEATSIRYKCTICGYIYEGDITKESDDYQCPICFVPKEMFEKVEDAVPAPVPSEATSIAYKCTICGYIYEGDISKESDDYKCPVCFVPKEMFEKVEVAAPVKVKENKPSISYKCTVCGYIYEGDITKESDDYKCPICFVPKEMFEKI